MNAIEKLSDKYIIEDSGNPNTFHYVHMFRKNEEVYNDFQKHQIFSLKEGLDRIIQLNLGIYLVQGFHPVSDIQIVKEYLQSHGYNYRE